MTRAEAAFVRASGESCFPSSELAARMVGCRLDPDDAKLAACAGGCTHLTDWDREAVEAIESLGCRAPRARFAPPHRGPQGGARCLTS